MMSTLPYLLAIVGAAGVDIAANMLLTKSEGFKHKKLCIAAIVFVCIAFTLLSFAIRKIDLAVAYAMWGALGILGTSLGGAILFGQKMKPVAWVGILILAGGIALMHSS